MESRLGRPSLVRETSRRSTLDLLRRPLSSLRASFTRRPADFSFAKIVLEPTLERWLQRVTVSTLNTTSHRSPFRNRLLQHWQDPLRKGAGPREWSTVRDPYGR